MNRIKIYILSLIFLLTSCASTMIRQEYIDFVSESIIKEDYFNKYYDISDGSITINEKDFIVLPNTTQSVGEIIPKDNVPVSLDDDMVDVDSIASMTNDKTKEEHLETKQEQIDKPLTENLDIYNTGNIESYTDEYFNDDYDMQDINKSAFVDDEIAEYSDNDSSEYEEIENKIVFPEIIFSTRVYAVKKPEILETIVFNLNPPVIEKSNIEIDYSKRISNELLYLSIMNSNSNELGIIAEKYETNANADNVLETLGMSSNTISKIRNNENNDSNKKEDKNNSNLQQDAQKNMETVNSNDELLKSELDESSLKEPTELEKNVDELKPNELDNISTSSKSSTINVSTSPANEYNFNIDSANQIVLYKIDKKDFIHLNGNAKISFELSGQNRVLKADSILYDVSENEILAFGNISISSGSMSSSSNSLQDLTASYLSINLNENKLRMVDAIGKTQKSNQGINSLYYMSGRNLVLDTKTSEIFFDSGSLLPSSNPNNANWSISADKILMKSNGDVLLSNIFLKIGRVPLVYVPLIFLLPSAPLTINPAIGFSSSKGAFVNFTYELLGKYPSLGTSGEKGNSLTNLFKSSGGGNYVKDGFLYKVSENSDSNSNSNDYLASFFDVYANEGVFFGLEGNKQISNKVKLSAIAGLAYKPQKKPSNYTGATYKNLRYYFDLTNFSVSDFLGFNISANAPFYSDPNVGYTYLNRLTAFAVDSLFLNSPQFPTSSSQSQKSEYSYSLKLNYGKPLKLPFVSNFSFSASVDYSRYWTENNPDEYYSYASGEFTLPSGSLNLSGNIFSLNKSSSSKSVKKEIDKNYENLSISERREKELLVVREKTRNKNVKIVSSLTSKVYNEKEFNLLELNNNNSVIDEASVFENRLGFDLKGDSSNKNEMQSENNSDEKNDNIDNKSDLSDASSTKLLEEKNAEDINKRYTANASVSDSYSSTSQLFSGSSASLSYSLSDSFSNVFDRPEDKKKILGKRKTTNSLNGTITFNSGIGSNFFTFNEVLTPSYYYSYLESSAKLTTNEFSLRSNTTSNFSIPLSVYNLSINHSISSVLYTYKSTKDDTNPEKTITEKKIKWEKDFISSHSVSVSMGFRSLLSFSLSTSLPPLDSYTLTPNLSFNKSPLSLRVSHTLSGENYSSLKNTKTNVNLSYSKSFYNFGLTTEYDYSKESEKMSFLKPFLISQNFTMNLFSSWLNFSESAQFYGLSSSGKENYFSSISSTLKVKSYFSTSFSLSGEYDKLKVDKSTFSLSIPKFYITSWKNRIILSLDLNTTANINFNDAFQNSLTYSLNFSAEVKEFINIQISLGGTNNNFLKYTGNERFGGFRPGAFLADIFRGLNFLSPDMSSSNFKMDSLNVEIVHDMGDFLLSFTFNGKFELNVNEYEWKPEYRILLRWGVIPELKVDKTLRP